MGELRKIVDDWVLGVKTRKLREGLIDEKVYGASGPKSGDQGEVQGAGGVEGGGEVSLEWGMGFGRRDQASILIYGSHASGAALVDDDVDILIMAPEFMDK